MDLLPFSPFFHLPTPAQLCNSIKLNANLQHLIHITIILQNGWRRQAQAAKAKFVFPSLQLIYQSRSYCTLTALQSRVCMLLKFHLSVCARVFIANSSEIICSTNRQPHTLT